MYVDPMSAFLARLDGRFFTALLRLADLLLELDRLVDDLEWWLEEWWKKRTPRHTGAHRLARGSYVRTWRHPLRGVPRRFDPADYEWGQAIQAMARRMEGSYRWR